MTLLKSQPATRCRRPADRLDDWRSQFVNQSSAAGLSPRVLEALRLWQSERRPDWTLPRFVRRRWNAKLKQFVLKALLGWFDTRRDPPDDLVDIAPSPRAAPSSEHRDEVDQLRDVVLRLVHVITREELEELRLPAAAYLRLKS